MANTCSGSAAALRAAQETQGGPAAAQAPVLRMPAGRASTAAPAVPPTLGPRLSRWDEAPCRLAGLQAGQLHGPVDSGVRSLLLLPGRLPSPPQAIAACARVDAGLAAPAMHHMLCLSLAASATWPASAWVHASAALQVGAGLRMAEMEQLTAILEPNTCQQPPPCYRRGGRRGEPPASPCSIPGHVIAIPCRPSCPQFGLPLSVAALQIESCALVLYVCIPQGQLGRRGHTFSCRLRPSAPGTRAATSLPPAPAG